VADDASGPAQEGKDGPRKSKANVRLQDPRAYLVFWLWLGGGDEHT
jgi:hypothetical protein